MKKRRDLEKTRSDILQVAFVEIFSHGFQGVSVDDIVKKTHLTKGALYHQFPTKLDLGYALVEEVITPLIIDRWIAPLYAYENPLEGILDIMQKLMGEADPEELKLGCPLNNLVQEMAPVDAGFKMRLEAALKFWIAELEAHLIRGKRFLKNDVDTNVVAHFIVMTHEGFYGMMKGIGNKGTFDALHGSMKIYLKGISKA